MLKKPTAIFDRDWEWGELRRFVADPRPGITFGIVSGHILLDHWSRAS